MNTKRPCILCSEWAFHMLLRFRKPSFLLASELATAQDRMSWHPQPSCPSLKCQWEWTDREGRRWTEWLLCHPQERMWQRESFYCWEQVITENTPSWKPGSDKREEVKKYVRSSGLITICLRRQTSPTKWKNIPTDTEWHEELYSLLRGNRVRTFRRDWASVSSCMDWGWQKNLSWRILRTSRNYAAQCGLLSSVSLPGLRALLRTPAQWFQLWFQKELSTASVSLRKRT